MTTRTLTVELSDFDSDDILDAALEIVTGHLERAKPDDGYRLKQWNDVDVRVKKLRNLLRGCADDDTSLPPPSTAAKMRTAEQLRAYLAKQAA